jgi:thiamine biosynthesis protein ThiS
MEIVVNAEPRDVPDGTTVADLLEQMHLEPRRVAVECNRKLIRRKDHAAARLSAGDELEIVTLVGGG